MILNLKRTDSDNSDFKRLVFELDLELKVRDGDDHDFYHQFNGIESLNHVVVAYLDDAPVACGAFKPFDDETMEIKRMYVPPSFRGNGFASSVLAELENWCRELNARRCILETGYKQPEAIGLYKRQNYSVIKNYGQYQGVETSICFEKKLF